MGYTKAGLSTVEIECVASADTLDLKLTGTEEEREKAVAEYLFPLFKTYIEENGLIYDEWYYSDETTDDEIFHCLKGNILPKDCKKLSLFTSLSEWVKGNEWKALVWVCLTANEGMSNTSMPMWC